MNPEQQKQLIAQFGELPIWVVLSDHDTVQADGMTYAEAKTEQQRLRDQLQEDSRIALVL
jgi:hypothetical protein